MEHFNSAKEHALSIAKKNLDLLVSGNCDTHIVLRGCYSVASLLGDEKNRMWIENELSGNPRAKHEDVTQGRLFTFSNKLTGKTEFIVDDSIHRIQHAVNTNNSLKTWDPDFINSHEFSPEWCYTILSSVQDRCLKYILETITQIEYSGKIYSLMNNIRKDVDDELLKINGEINSELQSIANNINAESSTERSKVAHSCRRILKLLADEVFPARVDLFEGRNVKEDAYMNRILAFLKTNGKSGLIKNQIEYLAPYFDSLRDLSGKGEHSEISKFEAEQIVLHTYLVMSYILKVRQVNTLDKSKDKTV